MAAEQTGGIELFSTLQEQLIATGDRQDVERAKQIGGILEARGQDLIYHPDITLQDALTPEPAEQQTIRLTAGLPSKVFPEISLPEEHRRQGLILARRFAGRLGMSQDDYIASLPQFPERPSVYDNRLGLKVPVIVENRIPWLEVAQLSHDEGEVDIFVTDYLRGKEAEEQVKEWTDDGFEMSKYAVVAGWIQDGTKFVNRKPRDVRRELLKNKEYKEHYRAGRIPLGNAIWNVRPDMVISMYWDLIGTSVGSDYCASLSHWFGQARLHACDVGVADPRFRALVFGSKVETRPLAA